MPSGTGGPTGPTRPKARKPMPTLRRAALVVSTSIAAATAMWLVGAVASLTG